MRLRIATLNVWALPGPLREKEGRRMKAIGRRLPELGLDVAAFQEVWTARARRILVEAGARAGMSHHWYRDGWWATSGLLVLSRPPIERVRFRSFYLTGVPTVADYYSGKGYAQLRLSLPIGSLTLVDTHLHARHTTEVKHEFLAHRIGQIVQLAFGARSVEDPLLAAGDFNFGENKPEHAVLTGLTGLRDLAAELGSREATALATNPYRSQTKPDRRIDYLFARDGKHLRLTPRRVERIFDETFVTDGLELAYSDHAGVMAEVELVPGRAAPPVPDPAAIQLARRALMDGRGVARRRQQQERMLAGTGLGVAILSAIGARRVRVSRRRLLRNALQVAGLAALTPTLGLSFLSEVIVPEELRMLETLAERLDRLDDPI